MKIYLVGNKKEIFGIYTEKEDAEKKKDAINRGDELDDGHDCVAYIKEVESKEYFQNILKRVASREKEAEIE